MSYPNRLPYDSWDGHIGQVRVKWSKAGPQRVIQFAADNGVSVQTAKALCEHLSHATAHRLGNDNAVIQYSKPISSSITTCLINVYRSAPHTESINSVTGVVSQDDLHIGVDTTGGGGGKNKTHIYIGGVGAGSTAYDNIWVRGENVMRRTKSGYVVEQSLSYGGVGLASGTAASGAAALGGPSNAPGPSNTAQAAGYSEWQWDARRNKYIHYNHTTQKWETEDGVAI